jgi:hypothetical protein
MPAAPQMEFHDKMYNFTNTVLHFYWPTATRTRHHTADIRTLPLKRQCNYCFVRHYSRLTQPQSIPLWSAHRQRLKVSIEIKKLLIGLIFYMDIILITSLLIILIGADDFSF